MLEICDRTTSEQIVAAEKHLAEVEKDSDFDDDLAVVTGKKTSKKSKNTENDFSDVESPSDDEANDAMEMDPDDYDETDVTDDEMLESEHSKVVNPNVKLKNKKSVTKVSESDNRNDFSEDEISHLSDDDDNDDDGDSENEENKDALEEAKEGKTWEDIYGRKRDKDGNIIKVRHYGNFAM